MSNLQDVDLRRSAQRVTLPACMAESLRKTDGLKFLSLFYMNSQCHGEALSASSVDIPLSTNNVIMENEGVVILLHGNLSTKKKYSLKRTGQTLHAPQSVLTLSDLPNLCPYASVKSR